MTKVESITQNYHQKSKKNTELWDESAQRQIQMQSKCSLIINEANLDRCPLQKKRQMRKTRLLVNSIVCLQFQSNSLHNLELIILLAKFYHLLIRTSIRVSREGCKRQIAKSPLEKGKLKSLWQIDLKRNKVERSQTNSITSIFRSITFALHNISKVNKWILFKISLTLEFEKFQFCPGSQWKILAKIHLKNSIFIHQIRKRFSYQWNSIPTSFNR